jgi:hypothetical protein
MPQLRFGNLDCGACRAILAILLVKMMSNTSDTATMRATEPEAQNEDAALETKPDVSDQSADELLPKLLSYFHNNKEELARALGIHRSTVDRWLAGKSRPNNSTLLRMRRLAQERHIE